MARPKKKKKAAKKGMAGGLSNPADLMSQLQRLQEEMLQAQEALAQEQVEVSLGGGAIRVVMSGDHRVLAVEIAEELLDPEEKEMLQDMLIAAFNQAKERVDALTAERLQALGGGLSLPGLGL